MKKTFKTIYKVDETTGKKVLVDGKPVPEGVSGTGVLGNGERLYAKALVMEGDTFDFEIGKELVSAKLDVKLAERRLKNASDTADNLYKAYMYIFKKWHKARKTQSKRADKFVAAVEHLDELQKKY